MLVMWNLAKKDVPDSFRFTGMADLICIIKGKNLIINVDDHTPFVKIKEALWRTKPYVLSFKVTSEDIGVALKECKL